MMSRMPIRWKLALWSSFASTIALLIFAIFSSFNLYFSLLEEEDEEVAIAAHHLLASYEESLQSGRPFAPSAMDSWINYAIFDETGKIISMSGFMEETLVRKALSGGKPGTLRHSGRLWRTNVFTSSRSSIASAYDLEIIRASMRHLMSAYLLSFPIVISIVALVAFLLSKKTLAPVRALADLAEEMGAERLHRRMPLPEANDEVRRLTCVLNEMFARLEKSFSQANRFSADASHELRTPLTIMRHQVEQLLHNKEDAESVENGLLSLQEELARIERTTEHLLQLSRFDAGQCPPMAASVDLTRLIQDIREDAELLASSRKISVEASLAEGITLTANADLLRRLLLNLFDNAVRYNHDEGRIVCKLSTEGLKAVVRIANTGPGIDPDSKTRIFERFFRSDPSRSDRSGHGLGLSLSREIARIHGGELALTPDSPEGWTEFTLTLPLSPQGLRMASA